MANHISQKRIGAYYIGVGLMVLGGILFASTFITFVKHFGDFSNIEANAKSELIRAFGGVALIFVGQIVRGIGTQGLAGSGVILNPEMARRDLEPYSRMAGGMVKDALEEADVNLGGKPERVIMIKCSSCEKLNEEHSKFCQECGKKF